MTPISSTDAPMWPRKATPCFQPALNPRSVTMRFPASANDIANTIAAGMNWRTPATTATIAASVANTADGSAALANDSASCWRQRSSGAMPSSRPMAIASGPFTRL